MNVYPVSCRRTLNTPRTLRYAVPVTSIQIIFLSCSAGDHILYMEEISTDSGLVRTFERQCNIPEGRWYPDPMMHT